MSVTVTVRGSKWTATSDLDRAIVLRLLAGVVQDIPTEIAVVTIPGAPQALERARGTIRTRFTPKGPKQFVKNYTPKRSRQAELTLADEFAQVSPRPFCYSNIALACVFFRPDRRILDLDNLQKLVMDAGTKASLWQDDSQVTATVARLELDAATPRTVIGLCRMTSTLDRTIPQKDRRDPAAALHQVFLAGR